MILDIITNTNLHAAVGLSQIEKLNKILCKKKKSINFIKRNYESKWNFNNRTLKYCTNTDKSNSNTKTKI